MRSSSSQAPLSVAIVGGGPRGLYCLERLAYEAGRSGKRLRVRIYEPTGEFGAGAVYGAGQPDYLRMNFADSQIDAWPEGPTAVGAARRHSFSSWSEREDRRDRCGYSPRSLVGEYLSDCYAAVVEALPRGIELDARADRIDSIERLDDGWLLRSSGGDSRCEELMIATGHRRSPDGAASNAAAGGRRLRYPLADSLDAASFAPGEPLRVRGMALSLIDAALELTQGRGGRFVGESAAGSLRYVASGSEPSLITAYSRSGRPMLVKPAPGAVIATESAAAATEPGRRRIRELGESGFFAGLTAIIAEAGAALLQVANGAGGSGLGVGSIEALLAARLGAGKTGPVDARRQLAESLAIAVGSSRPDATWALGEAWRSLYPALVERGSHGGVPTQSWAQFALLAREMERVAFGPPAVNGAKLLALIDAGIVALEPPGAATTAQAAPDLDAVLAAPGACERCGDLVDVLVDAGYVHRASAGRRGIEIGADGSCLDADGEPIAGLAAVGRVSEDWVIGNDTLSRRLHEHPALWAKRVAG